MVAAMSYRNGPVPSTPKAIAGQLEAVRRRWAKDIPNGA